MEYRICITLILASLRLAAAALAENPTGGVCSTPACDEFTWLIRDENNCQHCQGPRTREKACKMIKCEDGFECNVDDDYCQQGFCKPFCQNATSGERHNCPSVYGCQIAEHRCRLVSDGEFCYQCNCDFPELEYTAKEEETCKKLNCILSEADRCLINDRNECLNGTCEAACVRCPLPRCMNTRLIHPPDSCPTCASASTEEEACEMLHCPDGSHCVIDDEEECGKGSCLAKSCRVCIEIRCLEGCTKVTEEIGPGLCPSVTCTNCTTTWHDCGSAQCQQELCSEQKDAQENCIRCICQNRDIAGEELATTAAHP